MTTITNVLKLPNQSDPPAGAKATIFLVGTGGKAVRAYVTATGAAVVGTITVTADDADPDLFPNDELTPSGTAYKRVLSIPGAQSSTDYGIVDDSTDDGDSWFSILTEQPASIASSTYELLDQRVTALEEDGGGITDGDKGDITVSGSGSVWTIDSSGMTSIATALNGTYLATPSGTAQAGMVPIATGAGSVSEWGVVESEPPLTSPTYWRRGREWYTNFVDIAVDALRFDITNLTYSTDGGATSARATTAGAVCSIFTKEPLENCEVVIRWRAAADSGFNIVNIEQFLHGRYLNDSNRVSAKCQLTSGNAIMRAEAVTAGANQGSTGTTAVNNADATTYRYTKFRVTGDITRIKHWFADAAEPDWQVIERIRPGSVVAGLVDNIEVGVGGMSSRYGGIFQSVKVTELVRADDNLMWTPNPETPAIDTHGALVGKPHGWIDNSPAFTVATGDAFDIVTATDRFGDSRPVFHVRRTTSSINTSIPLWTQYVFQSGGAALSARKQPHPRAYFTRAVTCSVWSKGENVNRQGQTLAAICVIYAYDLLGTVSQDVNTYYHTLGSNGALVGASNHYGDGTWDWTESRWRMVIPAEVTSLRVQVGFHGHEITGELWFTEVAIRPGT